MPHHGQHGRRVDEKRRGLLIGNVGGDGASLTGRDHGIFGPVAPGRVDRRHALALHPAAEQARPGLIDDAHALEPRRGGQPGKDSVTPADHQQVGRIDRAGDHPDPDLARPRLREGNVANAQNLGRITKPLENGGFHSLSLARAGG